MADMRIYVVSGRLVKAASLAKAKAFVAKEIEGRLASQSDLVNMVGNGVEVEDSYPYPVADDNGVAEGL
jgi:hypothetical protein